MVTTANVGPRRSVDARRARSTLVSARRHGTDRSPPAVMVIDDAEHAAEQELPRHRPHRPAVELMRRGFRPSRVRPTTGPNASKRPRRGAPPRPRSLSQACAAPSTYSTPCTTRLAGERDYRRRGGGSRGGSTLLVKRVIALPGQTVMLRQGVLYVDGAAQALEQLVDGTRVEHLGEVTHAAGEPDFDAFGPVVVPPDHLFVMGDNRAASLDSRAMGAVPKELLRGRVLRVVYHHDAAGFDLSRALRSVD